MSDIERQVRDEMARCVHFTGVQHNQCKAGVVYLSVRDASGKGPYRWPCLTRGESAITTCAKRQLPTRAQAEKTVTERETHVQAFLAKVRDGKVCPTCDKPITGRQRVGRCIYLRPCGHRLGQAAALGEEP